MCFEFRAGWYCWQWREVLLAALLRRWGTGSSVFHPESSRVSAYIPADVMVRRSSSSAKVGGNFGVHWPAAGRRDYRALAAKQMPGLRGRAPASWCWRRSAAGAQPSTDSEKASQKR